MGLFDKLFSIDDARDDLREGVDSAARRRDAGKERATTAITSGRDDAIDTLSGDVEGGGLTRERLMTFLGLRGADAQTEAFAGFENDPGFEATQQAGIEAIDNSAAASGSLFSGGNQKDLFSFGQRGKFSQFQDRLDRLARLSATGSGASSQTAGIQFAAGRDVGNLEFGTAQMEANDAINLGQSVAGTRGQGLNNLIKLGTAAAKTVGAF